MLRSFPRLFRRYFFTFVVVTLFPVLVLGAAFNIANRQNVRREILSLGFSNVDTITKDFESDVAEWNSFTGRVSMENLMTAPGRSPAKLYDSANFRQLARRLDAVETIQKIQPVTRLLTSVVLYEPSSGFMISNGFMEWKFFRRYITRFEYPDNHFLDRLDAATHTPQRLQFLSSLREDHSNAHEYSLYCLEPLPFSSNTPTADAIYIVASSDLNTVFDPLVKGIGGALIITDRDGRRLYVSPASEGYRVPSSALAMPPGADRKFTAIPIDHRSYGLFSVQSSVGLVFHVVAPESRLSGTPPITLALPLLVTLLLFFAGVASAGWAARFAYRPIRDLAGLALASRLAERPDGQEVDIIRHALEAGKSAHHRLERERRNRIMHRLVSGQLPRQSVGQAVSAIALPPAPKYAVILLLYDNQDEERVIENAVRASLDSVVAASILFDLRDADGLGIVAGVPIESADQYVQKICATVEAAARSASAASNASGEATRVLTFHGSAYADPFDLVFSFGEAAASWLAASERVDVRPVTDDNGGERSTGFPAFPDTELYHFASNLRLANWPSVRRSLLRLRSDWSERSRPLWFRKAVVYGATIEVLKVLQAARISLVESDLAAIHGAGVPSFRLLYRACSRICRRIASSSEQTYSATRKRVETFMDDNFRKPTMNLEALSEHLGYSANYVSRFFRAALGSTFTEALRERRIAEAKRLLRETDLPVKAIVFECGYMDNANFIRTFRQIVGVTPGQYRALPADRRLP